MGAESAACRSFFFFKFICETFIKVFELLQWLVLLSEQALIHTGCLRKKKKYGVADYWCFKDGNTQQCHIFRHTTYNLCLVVCKISTPCVKRNESYELDKNDGVKRDLRLSNHKFIHRRILSSKSILT